MSIHATSDPEPEDDLIPTRDEDRRLVRRLLAGDESAFDLFASRHLRALYRFASRRLDGDPELTRELVQRTLTKVIRKLSSYRGEGPFFGWLCACCRNEIRMHFRRESSRPARFGLGEDVVPPDAVTTPVSGSPDRRLLRSEVSDHVHQALDLLPEHYSRALEWKYLEGLSVREIADRLKRSPKAAESVLSRARRAFRERYEEIRRGNRAEANEGRPR